MVDTIVSDLFYRASNDFEQDHAMAVFLQRAVSNFQNEAGAISPVCSSTFFYLQTEVDKVLDGIGKTKRCLRGSYAGLCAKVVEGRSLTCALVNFGRHVCLTSSFWSLRQITPLRKCGPQLVRRCNNLRPISLSVDMAHVQDGLWIARNGQALESFAGPGQVGGVSDTISLVLALLLLVQSRAHQGLPTYLVFVDLRWAFDVAIHSGMKYNAHAAGIVGEDWLLIDDFLDADTQYLQVNSLCSEPFSLGCGTAQGRRFSVHLFNGLLAWLRMEVDKVMPGGIRATLPSFACNALLIAEERQPASSYSDVPRTQVIDDIGEKLVCVAAQDRAPWNVTFKHVVDALVTLPSVSDRVGVLEYLGSDGLGPLQYVDDTTVPCPSAGAVRAVVAREQGSACSSYCRMTKSQLNYQPGKTAAMAMLSSPALCEDYVGCDVVDTYRLLGVLLDSDLTFHALLRETLRSGWDSFVKLYHASEASGFPLMVLAEQVSPRVESIVLYASAFLIMHQQAVGKFNYLQYRWARKLLGCDTAPHTKWILLTASCGWHTRLGTRLRECAIIALARLRLLPLDHPASRMLRLVEGTDARCWVNVIQEHMADNVPIIDITAHPCFSEENIAKARHDKEIRKDLLRRYRCAVVRPALAASDERAFATCAARVVTPFHVRFDCFLPTLGGSSSTFTAAVDGITWRSHRTWLILRLFGLWPVALFGGDGFPEKLSCCAACGVANVDVSHPLCDCAGTVDHFLDWQVVTGWCNREASQAFFTALFSSTMASGHLEATIAYVGKSVATCICGRHSVFSTVPDLGDDLDACLMLAAERARAEMNPFDIDSALSHVE